MLWLKGDHVTRHVTLYEPLLALCAAFGPTTLDAVLFFMLHYSTKSRFILFFLLHIFIIHLSVGWPSSPFFLKPNPLIMQQQPHLLLLPIYILLRFCLHPCQLALGNYFSCVTMVGRNRDAEGSGFASSIFICFFLIYDLDSPPS